MPASPKRQPSWGIGAMSRRWGLALPVRFLAALMDAYKRSADQTMRVPGAGTPGYPDWPKVSPPPGATGRRRRGSRRRVEGGLGPDEQDVSGIDREVDSQVTP